jgi:hypothetical protein
VSKDLKPQSKRSWDYRTADKAYGLTRMFLNPDRYPGMFALNPARLFAKPEAPGIQENSNGALEKTLALFCIQSLSFRDQHPFIKLCQNVVLKSPMLDDEFRSQNPDFLYLKFLDVHHDEILYSYLNMLPPPATVNGQKPQAHLFPDLYMALKNEKLQRSKNYDARVCALRQRNRNNYIMYLTQGQYNKRQ